MFKRLLQQTFIYGIATVIPKILNYFLVPLHTSGVMTTAQYGEVSNVFAYFVLFNVVMSYGMETAFFRFFHKEKDREEVVSTSAWSLVGTSFLFLLIGYLFQRDLAGWGDIPLQVVQIALWILVLDALVVVPFAWLRAKERPVRYAVIKTLNVGVNLILNYFFLWFLFRASETPSFWGRFYIAGYQVEYVFWANLIASLLTLVVLLPFYFKIRWRFNTGLWKRMMHYSIPILISGLAYAINEASDRMMMMYLLPEDIAKSQLGIYAACYKLAVFMALFTMAFRLGIEPFFFKHAQHRDAKKTYAEITKYFTIFGSLILVAVMVFIDLLKRILIKDPVFWEAMDIVPLILLANLFLGIYYNLSVWYKVTDLTRYGSYISIIAAGITIVANLWLIPLIGYIGAAIGTLAAYAAMMLLSYIWGQKYYRIPYDLKKLTGYLSLAMLFSALSFYVFRENYVVSSLLFIIFAGIIYRIERKRLKEIWHS